MNFLELIWLIPLIPLGGAAAMLFFGRRMDKPLISVIGPGTVGLSLVLSIGAVAQLAALGNKSHEVVLFEWLPLIGADWGFLLDPLSAVMILVVTFVGFLIHIYATGYMAHEPGPRHGGFYRFFGYMNLFVFFMLTLVLANNYPLLFVGWEGVGLCSYLLIGFYFHKKSASDAANKAFIVNRIGDAGFILGMFFLFQSVGSLRFAEVNEALASGRFAAETGAFGLLSLTAVLLFVGATGKSAQIPLFVWLPDAMEGPTPVSALIHAATMVAAGVYLVARMYPVFHYTDHGSVALAFVAGVGTVTALMAATIGLVMNDIKRVLAYSTVSQLGYMMMGLGVGGYTAGMFHLFTHAFFKAGLFLGSGSVIHGTGTQDIREMGGLARRMPHTYRTFLLATAALAGIFPFAGFWSKDEILLDAWLHARWVFYAGLAGAVLTAFYMGRLVIKTFLGEPRRPDIHAHESPPVMTVPLWILAFLSVTAGLVNTPWGPLFHHYVSFGDAPAPPFSAGVAAAGTAAALLGLLGAFAVYRWEWVSAATLKRVFHPLYVLFANRWFVDEILYALLVKLLFAVCRAAFAFDRWVVDGLVNLAGRLGLALSRIQGWLDRWVVDGLVNLVGYTVRGTGWLLTRLQTGLAQTNVLLAFAGLAALVWLLVYR